MVLIKTTGHREVRGLCEVPRSNLCSVLVWVYVSFLPQTKDIFVRMTGHSKCIVRV